jgi:hypothetical protein
MTKLWLNQAVRRWARGVGRLWITKYKLTHTGDGAEDKTGKIEWMRFAVEIKLPNRRKTAGLQPIP